MSKGSIAAPKDQGKWKNSFGNTLFQEWEGCDLEPGLTSATHMTVGNYPTHPLSTHLSIHPSIHPINHSPLSHKPSLSTHLEPGIELGIEPGTMPGTENVGAGKCTPCL